MVDLVKGTVSRDFSVFFHDSNQPVVATYRNIFVYSFSFAEIFTCKKKSVMFSVIDTAEFSMTMTLQGTNPFFQDLWELLKG